MSALTIYLWTRMNGINCLILLIAIGYFVYFAAMIVSAAVEADSYGNPEKCERYSNKAKKTIIPMTLWASLFALIPTQKDLAMMYVIPSMVNSETFAIVKKETPEIAQIALDALKDVLRDSADNKKEHQKGE